MAIQILSDLHLEVIKEYDIFEIAPKAPHLALLGDIGNLSKQKDVFLAFLRHQLTRFRTVLFVPGNHEAYGLTWPETLSVFRTLDEDSRKDASLGHFVLLDRASFHVPDTNTVILGCSLFSSVPQESLKAASLGLNDFFQTGDDWDVNAHNAAHQRDVAWLNAQVEELERRDPETNIIIFTHWSPSTDARATDPKHANSPISSGFSTDLSGQTCFTSDRVKLWAFGHTHFNCDFEVERAGRGGPLRLLANQRGYVFSQAEGFDREKTIEI